MSIAAARPMLDHVHAALEEDLLEHLGQVGIVVGQDLVASRDERHPGAAAGEVGELTAGRARAQHDHVLGELTQVEHLAGGQHGARRDGRTAA